MAEGRVSQVARAVPPGVDPLVAWAFGSFHAAVLVAVVVLVAHLRDALGVLGGLSTGAGLLLYALVWVVSWQATARALARAPPDSGVGALVVAGAAWGAGAGVGVVLAGVAVVLAPVAVIEGEATALVLLAAAGSVVGTVVGAVVGVALALLDAVLVAAVGVDARPDGADDAG